MSFFNLIKLVQKAFQIESEEELVYLLGKKLREIEYMKLKKPKYSGFFLRTLVFFDSVIFSFAFKKIRWRQKSLLIFAGTDNQLNSLKTTITALHSQKIDYELLLGKVVSKKNIQFFPQGHCISLGFIDVFLALAFYFYRGIPLYFKFKKQNRWKEIKWHFNHFCQTYVYLPYFLNILQCAQPKLVIMSNDHNVYNRCLRLAAEVLRIKTLYMQHASVSDIFPPLEFDYALLDGHIALVKYIQAYETQKNSNSRIEKNIKKCRVILSGQKKLIVSGSIVDNLNKDYIGLAINKIDDFYHVKNLLDKLVKMKAHCIVRTHPLQNPIFIDQLKNYIKDIDQLTWSNSCDEGLLDFFSKINSLISGNSSIHLEAALANLSTFYYEMSDEIHKPDYYGYVKNNISLKLEQEFTLDEMKKKIQNRNPVERQQAIKKYSETFGTSWQNREGELSAWIIKRILKNESFDDYFELESSEIYQSIIKLKKQDEDFKFSN